MRFNRDIAAIAVLVVVLIIGALLLTAAPPSSHLVGENGPQDPSVFNNRPSGSRACFEWVRTIGYTPTVWRSPWSALERSKATLMLVIDPRAIEPITGISDEGDAPSTPDRSLLTATDAASLQSWVKAGRTVILMTSRLPTGHTTGKHGQADTFGDAFGLTADAALMPGRTEFGPLQPVPDTQDILSVYSNSDIRLRRSSPDALALFGDNNGPLVLAIPLGKGRVIVIADARFASNSHLARSENADFLSRLLAQARPEKGVVLFDEYHHGNIQGASGATLWTALGRPLQLMALQLIIAGVLLIGVVAVRFGLPIPLRRGQIRQSTDYVTSLASLYRRAQASPAALETLYHEFLHDVTACLFLPPDANLEQLADTAARHAGTDNIRLRRLLTACEQHLDAGIVSEPELLALVKQMEAVRKELGIA